MFQNPNLEVGIFLTTYTYLNTILDGEQPLVVTTKHTVTNTVTAPDDYLSLLQPSDVASAVKDTNTYYSTVSLEKTLYEGINSKIISTEEILTQVVVTESIPPMATSVMTSYIALDFEDSSKPPTEILTTDVVKTYYVTYTYRNTIVHNGNTVVHKNVSTSADIVTEKIFINPKRTKYSTHIDTVINTSIMESKNKINAEPENFKIFATKTYITTYTSLTTLLQEEKNTQTTVISSNSRIVENIVTETIDPDLLDPNHLNSLKSSINDYSENIITTASLRNGQKIEITAVPNFMIEPTKAMPLQETKTPKMTTISDKIEPSNPNVITGSTILFIEDEDPFAALAQSNTPQLMSKVTNIDKSTIRNPINSLLSSEIVKEAQTSKNNPKRNANKKTNKHSNTIAPTKQLINDNKSTSEPSKKKPDKTSKPTKVTDLLGLGPINIQSLQALTPVLNAMAGLINTNLKSSHNKSTTKQEVMFVGTDRIFEKVPSDVQNRSPIYIPVGDLSDIDVAESQNIATYQLNEPVPWMQEQKYKDQVVIGKPTHESPLLNGGIPISPGEVITANSDVIIGKPGRIGPRIPSIPLHENQYEDDIVGIKPPPIQNKNWGKAKPPRSENSHPLKNIPIIHAPNKNDYFGPPPPLLPKTTMRVKNNIRQAAPARNKPYHIPLNFQQINVPILNNNNYDSQNREPEKDNSFIDSSLHINKHNLQNEISTLILGSSIIDFNIQTSLLKEPNLLPEVIERSTGQPLLVNIQPSQVAIINIPHNRTTALIYGGSTEPHINGQYFDDPSPYPQPEFSGIENFNNGIPQIASIYHDSQSQKEVGGVIKVGTQLIDSNPQEGESVYENVDIKPSRPISNHNKIRFDVNHDVNHNVPPISFGMMQHANDFNAHIINHGDINFTPPPISYTTHKHHQNKDSSNFNSYNYFNNNVMSFNDYSTNLTPPGADLTNLSINNRTNYNELVTFEQPPNYNGVLPIRKPNPATNLRPPSKRPNIQSYRPKYSSKYPSRYRPKPVLNNIISYMIPPLPSLQQQTKLSKPQVQPDNSQMQSHYPLDTITIPLHTENYNKDNDLDGHYDQFPDENDDSLDDDLINEDGEVVQESNSRPLRPGQIPIEILLANKSTTTEIPEYNINLQKVPKVTNNNYTVHKSNLYVDQFRPVINTAKPFGNQQNNYFKQNKPDGNYNRFTNNIYRVTTPKVNLNIATSTKDTFLQNVFKYKNTVTERYSTTTERNQQKVYSRKPLVNATLSIENMYSQVLNKIGENISRNDVHFNVLRKNNTNSRKNIYYTTKLATERVTNNYFNYPTRTTPKNILNTDSPLKITSLPIDIPISTTGSPLNVKIHYEETQTEKSFSGILTKLVDQSSDESTFEVSHSIPTEKVLTTQTENSRITNENINLNIGEVPKTPEDDRFENISNIDIGMMKPPPMKIYQSHVAQPDIVMHPPKIEINSPSGGIYRVPSLTKTHPLDLETQPDSAKPYIPKPSEDMLPPPKEKIDDVIGLNPPPPITTHRPILNMFPNITTYKPILSLEKLDGPLTSKITQKHSTANPIIDDLRKPATQIPSRKRRPFTRRPLTTTTKGSKTTITKKTEENVPMDSNKSNSMVENKITNRVYSRISNHTISPSPTIKQQPTMEVIIGNPNVLDITLNNSFNSEENIQPSKKNVMISSSEETITDSEIKATQPITKHNITFDNKMNIPTSIKNVMAVSKSNSPVFTTGLHHAGNEIKIIDDVVPTNKVDKPVTFVKETKTIVPTRFITHTKTSTVTITKTTVVKSLGAPPSTMTILVTKTEKQTILERVTEFHTLVQPTSIVETITTTINQPPASLYPADVTYGSMYPPIKPTLTESIIYNSQSIVPLNIFNVTDENENDDDLEEFIINETDPPLLLNENVPNYKENESIFVVMTDKNRGSVIKVPTEYENQSAYETESRDEILTNNDINRVLLGGILIASPPSLETPNIVTSTEKCTPECKASRNELCQRVEGIMRCVCRPGFARMFPDRPCKRK